ncbi:hypothetical protein BHM03_00039183, partial [Ensete ventricosum]
HVKPTTRTCSCFFLLPSHCGFSLLLPVITAEQSLLCYTIDSLPVLISRVELLCPLLSTFPERVSRVVAVARRTSIVFYSSWQASALIHLWHRLLPLLQRLQSHQIRLQSTGGITSALAAQAARAAAGRESGSLKVRHYLPQSMICMPALLQPPQASAFPGRNRLTSVDYEEGLPLLLLASLTFRFATLSSWRGFHSYHLWLPLVFSFTSTPTIATGGVLAPRYTRTCPGLVLSASTPSLFCFSCPSSFNSSINLTPLAVSTTAHTSTSLHL